VEGEDPKERNAGQVILEGFFEGRMTPNKWVNVEGKKERLINLKQGNFNSGQIGR